VILARSKGIPVVYVLEWYRRYPVAVMAPAAKKIKLAADLEGKTVGLPGFFGSSYVGWKALVYATGLNEKAVNLKQLGFTLAESIQQGVVDAAVVYVVNEPVQLRTIGMDIDVIEVSSYIDLVSNGLVVGEILIREDPDLVRRMTRATLRGIQYAIDHPDEAFRITRETIPEMTDEVARGQRKVLEAAIELWRSDTPGKSRRQAWVDSATFMQRSGLISQSIDVDKAFTNRFIE
jgi:NitT/TauT family transport system substrate-binding protein